MPDGFQPVREWSHLPHRLGRVPRIYAQPWKIGCFWAHPLPVIAGIDRNRQPVHEPSDSRASHRGVVGRKHAWRHFDCPGRFAGDPGREGN